MSLSSQGTASLTTARRKAHGVLSRCPGTAEYTGRYGKLIVEAARKRHPQLLMLRELGLGGNKILRARLRHFQNQLAAIGVWEDAIAKVSGIVIVFFLLILVPTFLPVFKDTPSRLSLTVRVSVLLAIAVLALVVAWAILSISRIQRTHEYLRALGDWAWLFVIMVTFWLGLLVFSTSADDLRNQIVPSFKLVFKLAGSLLLPIVIWGGALGILFRRRRSTICPEAVVSDRLLQMLTVLRFASDWRDLSKRSQLLGQLEDAATCIESGLPRRLRSGDAMSDLWLRERATRMAAALRKLKLWVATPKDDTRQILLERIKADLVRVASGNWDELAEAEARRISFRIRAALIARDLTIALLPFCAVVCLSCSLHRWYPDLAEPHILNALLGGCLLWLIYRAIIMLDPRLSTEGVKFLDFLPGWGKHKG